MVTRTTIRVGATACAVALALAGCGGGKSAGGAGRASLGPSKPAPVEIGRNVVRVPGLSPADVSAAAVLSTYDPRAGRPQPEGFVLVGTGDWQNAVIAAQFAAKPVSAGLLAIKREFIPTAPDDVLARVHPTGFPKAEGLKVMVLGHAGDDVYADLQDLALKPTELQAKAPALSAKLVPFRGGWARKYSDTIAITSADARDYALPVGAWSAYSGDTVGFVHRNSIPASTKAMLVQREKLRLRKPAIYVVAPKSVISDAVVQQLRAYGPVQRVAGRDAVQTSVALARFHDPATGFGWGVKRGPASVSIVNVGSWANAIGAFTYAATGPQAPLLLTNQGSGLPKAVTGYLSSLRGPKPNQAFIFGGPGAMSSATAGQLDGLLDAKQ